jgi:hypothetical protein
MVELANPCSFDLIVESIYLSVHYSKRSIVYSLELHKGLFFLILSDAVALASLRALTFQAFLLFLLCHY